MNLTDISASRIGLIILVIAYWVVAGLFAVRTPDWQTPDEPAHYNYIAQIAEQGIIPVIESTDWNRAYLGELTSNAFDPALLDDLDTVQYEDHQPPLYYLLATPIYSLTDGSLTALRLFSVALGTLIVVSAAGIGWLMFPTRPMIGLGAAAFVAFQPMHVAFLAACNNDSLGWAIVAVTLLAAIAYVKGYPVKTWQMGLLVGIGLITKATTYFMAGIVGIAILLVWWQQRQSSDDDAPDFRQLITRIAAFVVPALIFGLIWWGRNIDVYGFPDFLGLAAHDVVVADQPRTADLIDSVGFNGYLEQFTRTTFQSFWAQFGWMALPLTGNSTYTVIRLLLLISFAGIAVDMAFLRRHDGVRTTPEQRHAWILLTLTTLLAIIAYLYYNSEFLQHQGRYMFPLLIPLGIWLAIGVDSWRRLILWRWRESDGVMRWSPYLTPLAFCLIAVWDIWLLWRVIVPNL